MNKVNKGNGLSSFFKPFRNETQKGLARTASDLAGLTRAQAQANGNQQLLQSIPANDFSRLKGDELLKASKKLHSLAKSNLPDLKKAGISRRELSDFADDIDAFEFSM